MFESDDFDQVLSQFDFPELSTKENDLQICNQPTEEPKQLKTNNDIASPSPELSVNISSNNVTPSKTLNDFRTPELKSPKHSKRKILNSHFDTKRKRKFPGPAGLLTGSLEESTDNNIGQLELLSQDIDFSQNHLQRDVFESPLWTRLLEDARTWDLGNVDSIKTIKQQALTGNLRKRKAQTITAFVEAVDRSAIDPLVILRDASGNIKSTLHRDAWLAFSPYIASEYCAFILRTPTVLTTGSAYKKHYLNITLSNIYAIYSSAILKDDVETKPLPESYRKVYEDDFTVIKTDCFPQNNSDVCIMMENNVLKNSENDDLLDGLDGSIFLDEIF